MASRKGGRPFYNTRFSVYDHICLFPGSTRSSVASGVGLSLTSVGIAVDRLIDDGLVFASAGTSGGGRPAEVLFPLRNRVFLAIVKEASARAFCLDLSGKELFFDERMTDSPADRVDALCELIRSAEASVPRDEGGYFAAVFLSPSSIPVDRDVKLFAKTQFSPLFTRTVDSDLLSAEVSASNVPSGNRALYCSVSRDGVTASFCKAVGGKTVFGPFAKVTSSYGVGFSRAFTACRNEKEAGEALSDALLNTVAIASPDTIIVELSGGGFDGKIGDHLKTALGKRLTNPPKVITIFRDEDGIKNRALSLLRRIPFLKEGKEK